MPQPLYAGFSQVDITPPFAQDDPNIQVHDPLYARVLLLRQGEESAALVTADLFTVETTFDEKLRTRLLGTSWLNPDNILVCPSHAGFSPVFKGGYIYIFNDRFVDQSMEDLYADRVAQAIAQAGAEMSEVCVGVGAGMAPDVLYNRRTLDPDGHLVMTFTLPASRPDLTFGPSDPEVSVLRFDSAGGLQKGALVVFGCHALCSVDRYGHVTADYPGYVVDVFQKVAGIPALFAMGLLGNIVPIERQGQASRRIGRSVGAMALYAFEQVQTQPAVALQVARRDTTLPLRPLPSLEKARESYAADPHNGRARHNLFLAEEYGERHVLPYTMRAIILGDTVILHLPGEIFVQTGIAIKEASPFDKTIVISRATGEVGYVPTPEDQHLGGMEPELTALDVGGEAVLRQQAIEFLHDLART